MVVSARPASMLWRSQAVYLDIDDVICLDQPYGYGLLAKPPPRDLWQKLVHGPAVQALQQVMGAHEPWGVVTSDWLR